LDSGKVDLGSCLVGNCRPCTCRCKVFLRKVQASHQATANHSKALSSPRPVQATQKRSGQLLTPVRLLRSCFSPLLTQSCRFATTSLHKVEFLSHSSSASRIRPIKHRGQVDRLILIYDYLATGQSETSHTTPCMLQPCIPASPLTSLVHPRDRVS
jgi:hypothetical protein